MNLPTWTTWVIACLSVKPVWIWVLESVWNPNTHFQSSELSDGTQEKKKERVLILFNSAINAGRKYVSISACVCLLGIVYSFIYLFCHILVSSCSSGLALGNSQIMH